MNRPLRLSLVLGALVLAGASPARAGVPKVVFGEDFAADWCVPCLQASCALEQVQIQFGRQFVYVETHIFDPYSTSETQARSQRYGVLSIPDVVSDGVHQRVGADDCTSTTADYATDISARLAATGGVSPVRITGELALDGNQATVTAHYTLVDPGSYAAHQATVYVYEDSVAGTTAWWPRVVRMVRSSPLTLTTVGEVKTVSQAVDVGGTNHSLLHAVAIYEEIAGSKTVLQASTDFVRVVGVEPGPPAGTTWRLTVGRNPVHGVADLRFEVGTRDPGDARLVLLDASGRQVRSLLDGPVRPGSHLVTWDLNDGAGRPVPAGMYFARLLGGRAVSTCRLAVVR